MNIPARITSDAAKCLEYFGQTLTHRPQGKLENARTVTGIFTQDEFTGAGEPEVVDEQSGKRLMRRGLLELAASVEVDTSARNEDRDTFVIDEEIWTAERRLGRDDAMQTIVLVKEEKVTTTRMQR